MLLDKLVRQMDQRPEFQSTMPPSVRALRWFCLRPHFRGKSRLESVAESLASFPPAKVEAEFPSGFRMVIDCANSYERSVYLRNGEPDTYLYITRYLKPGMVFIDCGANLGFYSLLASRVVGPKGKVVAFEPTPGIYGRLIGHLELNRCTNARAVQMALGERSGRASICMVNSSNHGMNKVLTDPGEARLAECELGSLDEFITAPAGAQSHLVKIDVEGSEFAVLRGMDRILRTDPCPTLIVELGRQTMAPFGYEPEHLVEHLMSVRPFQLLWPYRGEVRPLNIGQRLPHYEAFGPNHSSNYVFQPERS